MNREELKKRIYKGLQDFKKYPIFESLNNTHRYHIADFIQSEIDANYVKKEKAIRLVDSMGLDSTYGYSIKTAKAFAKSKKEIIKQLESSG